MSDAMRRCRSWVGECVCAAAAIGLIFASFNPEVAQAKTKQAPAVAVGSPAKDGVPHIDFKHTCSLAPDVTGTPATAKTDIDNCVTDEQDARNQLVKEWAGFSTADRAGCAVRPTTYLPNYVELLTCLQTFRDSRKMPDHVSRP
jgi:hypothetical protein